MERKPCGNEHGCCRSKCASADVRLRRRTWPSQSPGQDRRLTNSPPPPLCAANASRYGTMCGRPLGCKRKKRILTGGSTAIMCPALSTRRHDRWPRWGSAIQSQTIQRLREPLAPTGSLDRRFDRSSSHSALSPWHPRVVHDGRPADAGRPPRVIVAHAVGPSRCSITAEAARWFDRLKIRKIEIDDCLQGIRRCALSC